MNSLQSLSSIESGEAIRELYRTQWESVTNFIINQGGTKPDAADIFQESVIILLEKIRLGSFRGESSPGTFLQAIARNLWLTEMRTRKRRNAREQHYQLGEDLVASPSEPEENSSISKLNLQQIILQLGNTCQKILRGVYYENRKMRELLQDFDFANEQVLRNQKAKCMKKLRGLIAEDPLLFRELDIKTLYE